MAVTSIAHIPTEAEGGAPDLPAGVWPFILSLTGAAALGGFMFGFDTAVISGTVRLIQQQFGLDAVNLGWFVSSALVGCVLGVLATGLAADRYGSQPMLLLSALLFASSAAACAMAGNFPVLVLSRFVGGLGIGMASILAPLYISEIAPAAYRGRLVATYQVAITIGIVAAYASNAALLHVASGAHVANAVAMKVFVQEPWRAMLGSALFPAIAFLLLIQRVPHSPRWLVLRARDSEALAILTRINGPERAAIEIGGIRETIARHRPGASLLLGAPIRRVIVLGALLAFLSQVSGINAVIYYGPLILEQAGFSTSNAFGGQVIIGLALVAATLAALAMIDRAGRRPLMLGGVSGLWITLIAIGTLFGLPGDNAVSLLIAILSYIVFFSISYGPVVWVLLAELYPTQVRGAAMSIATLSLWLGTVLVGQITPWLIEVLGTRGMFWVFAACTAPALPLCFWGLPETRGRTLEAIETYWTDRAGKEV